MKRYAALLLSRLYGWLVGIHRASYTCLPFRMRKVDARVISVGNITWGGTGKTPLTIRLAKDIAFYGKKVAVLTRGYGKDEVAELQKEMPGIPLLVGRDRIRSARKAIAKHKAEVIILDDGFQHIRLRRDLDIVTINSTAPFGPGGLIPLGTLREPVENLKRADIFIITKSNIGTKNVPAIRQKIQSLKPGVQIFEATHKPVQFVNCSSQTVLSLDVVRGKKIGVFSGIEDFFSFEKTLEKLGAEILFAGRFDDHHAYKKEELKHFLQKCHEVGAKTIVTTNKDFCRMSGLLKEVQCSGGREFNLWSLQIEFQIDNEEEFIKRCLNV